MMVKTPLKGDFFNKHQLSNKLTVLLRLIKRGDLNHSVNLTKSIYVISKFRLI